MKVFLNIADKKRETGQLVGTWVGQVRDVAYGTEDILDIFLLQIASMRRRRRGFAGCLISRVSSTKEHHIKHGLQLRYRVLKLVSMTLAREGTSSTFKCFGKQTLLELRGK
ncbi:hypothetical protein AMTR_s00061p00063800 [Amborella trichopoda]|uniref:Disease resistance N-terminal domain-containing protein n=1 Tax=Amborella trichopoda TaxID=13333 RepID=U5D989_AMBTC|nr:hypothetical protein AMTR_s00061p00063800 [Amborella trichopoda]